MKRIFSLVLALSLILATFCISPVSYADESHSDKAIEVVAKLGLMKESLTANPNIEITRGDLIESVLNLCGKPSDSSESVFADLAKEHPNFDAIMTAYNMEFVSGFGDGTVRPDDAATVAQAMKLIYYALGYKEFLAQTNSPAMAVERARVGTISDTNSAKILTAGKLADLMVQAGESYPLETQQITNDGDVTFKYYNAKETVLERYYDIVRVEGVVTSAGGMNLVSGQSYNSDWIVIGGTVLRKDQVSADSYFGQRVVAYYRQYKGEADKRLECLYSYNTTVHEISAELYDGYSDGEFTYEVGDMEYKDIKLSFSTVDMFVNNTKVENPDEKYFDINSGKITLIDNNRDKKIDVVIVVEYETYVVDNVNASLNAIFGKYNSRPLMLDEYQNVNMVAENGDVVLIEELATYDVLSVIKSADKSNISIVYALTELRGTIEEIRETNGRFYVTIGGKEYRVTDDCYFYEGSFLTTGRTGLFPLNAAGEVATFRATGDLARYGYITQTKQTPGLVSRMMSKILDQNGEFVIYEYDRYVKVDGKVMNSVDAIPLLNHVLVSYVVQDGIVKSVDTPTVTYEGLGKEESHFNSLQIYYDGNATREKLKYKATSGILGFKVAVNPSAPIFLIPSVLTDPNDEESPRVPDVNAPDEKYRVGSRGTNMFGHNSEYSIIAYKMQNKSLSADAVLMYSDTDSGDNIKLDTSPMFVESTTRINDAKGDPVTRITGYVGQTKKELYLTDDIQNSKIGDYVVHGGDIIHVEYDIENYITKIRVIYNYEKRRMENEDPYNAANAMEDSRLDGSNMYIRSVNVYKRSDRIVLFTTQELVPGTDYEGVELENQQILDLSTYTMFKYDERTKTVSKAEISDVVAFEETGSICSKIIVNNRQADPRNIYVFNTPIK